MGRGPRGSASEEDLVEMQVTWDLGKALELKISNEKAMIDALAKI